MTVFGPRFLRAATLSVMLALMQVTLARGCLAADRPISPTLGIQLEDDVFLEGQSIYMIACLRNAGESDIYDVAPLSPRIGCMRVDLIRKDTGEHLAKSMPIEGGTRREGVTLGPGRVLCVVRDLTLYFGTVSQDSLGLASRLGSLSLPVGEYLLRCEYDLHTGNRKGIRQTTIRGQDILFSVKKLASEPQEESLVSEFLSGLPRVGIDRSPLHAYVRTWLPRFYGSKYLLRIYMSAGQLLNDLDFDAIFDGVSEAGAPPARRAALLGVRLSMTDLRNRFTPEWKQSMEKRVDHQLERDVLSIEPRKPKPQ